MSEELDDILLEQLHECKRRKKLIKRLRKVMKNEHLLYVGEEMVDKKIQFFEDMIENKSLLSKKPKKRKTTQSDLLARNPVYEWYRNTMFITTITYKMLSDYVSSYMSYFKKDKE